ncbi:MAG: hypothetical protein FJY65_07855 [Calditrichaeota bacterium]|nr:hypothetical protein [Calditrichota bacterium]
MLKTKKSRLIAGCMTGTSIDGIDAALVRVEGAGLKIKAEFVRGISRAFGEWAEVMQFYASQLPLVSREVAQLADVAAEEHCRGLRELLQGIVPDLIVIHGQTVYHKPPLSWQLVNPWPVAVVFQTPVLYDLRGADIAAGGQGAPITPIADFILFREPSENRIVVNLGGFCNITHLPKFKDEKSDLYKWLSLARGEDVCVCNRLLDEAARLVLKRVCDLDGANALQGRIDADLYQKLMKILNWQTRVRRSLGTGDELQRRLKKWASKLSASDFLRTACAAVAQTIVNAGASADRLIIAGGGAKNRALWAEITSRSPAPVALSDDFGIPAAYREAAAMAVLGALCQDRVPITLTNITQAKRRTIAGCWCDVRMPG